MFDFFKKKTEENNLQETNEEKKGLFSLTFESLKKTIEKTSESLVGNIIQKVEQEEEFDEFILDDMEELLIKADLGVNTASSIVDKLRKKSSMKPSQVKEYLQNEFSQILNAAGANSLNYKDNELNIYFIVGVNGAGKTTLIGKLAHRFKTHGKKVLVAAGDTFRAAAEEQLNIWSQRAGADIVRNDGADPASVVYDAIQKAKNEHYDVILVDTAGRLQNKFNLMQELSKIKAVIDKNAPESLKESILVLDANTGQNGLSQAKVFTECVNLTSVALTKLDGSAKGGIIIGIAKEMNLPVKLIGVGEKMDDLKDFEANEFIKALFS
ncbi:MAG: signal recognition particle-docking protein FtsY [Clostridium sp.]|nr:signal recognition particle-docking protein FtsY [Clostridium sp.]